MNEVSDTAAWLRFNSNSDAKPRDPTTRAMILVVFPLYMDHVKPSITTVVANP